MKPSVVDWRVDVESGLSGRIQSFYYRYEDAARASYAAVNAAVDAWRDSTKGNEHGVWAIIKDDLGEATLHARDIGNRRLINNGLLDEANMQRSEECVTRMEAAKTGAQETAK